MAASIRVENRLRHSPKTVKANHSKLVELAAKLLRLEILEDFTQRQILLLAHVASLVALKGVLPLRKNLCGTCE